MRARAGNGPRNMTDKLLSRDESDLPSDELHMPVDQIALTMPLERPLLAALANMDRLARVDLVVAYDPESMRSGERNDDATTAELKRLGVIRGRPGIGYPAAVHLERCATPARVVVTDSPNMGMLGGMGMLTLVATTSQLVEAMTTGRLRWRAPQVVQVILSGRLSPSVTARDVGLELRRLGLAETIRSLFEAVGAPVVVEFSGPGMRAMTVSERSLLCSTAPELGATAAIATSDEKTDLFLRDQRRSKAFRQLAPDPGAPCAEVLCLDLGGVTPLVALGSGVVTNVADLSNQPIREVVIGGDSSASLRDLLAAVAWFKTKRSSAEVDLIVVPATRQIFEAIAANGTLALLLSAGARLLEPDLRLLTGQWHPPPHEGTSLRSFPPLGGQATCFPGWALASIDTLCTSAIAGSLQDPRALRKAPRVTCPRELPIDDALLFDKKPSNAASIPPPSANVSGYSTGSMMSDAS